jgi:uncharacterized protein with FMN-binding domain
MSRKQTNQAQGFAGTIKRFFLSAFVIVTFVAYFLHERLANPANANAAGTTPTTGAVPTAPTGTTTGDPAATATNPGTVPTATPAPVQGAAYKNGTYTGPSVNVYYGNVQVQVVIQNGKIANVTFLDYPHDRRTSQMINNQAMPWLTQEAIQAQSANVNLISGATLTSEGFANSLQAALQTAQN